MKRSILLLMMLLAVTAIPAWAIVPETGLYWMPDYSGTAVYVESQNGTVVVTIYAFDPETGQAEIYTSAGPLRDDGTSYLGSVVPSPPPQDIEGLFPYHWYQGDLYRVTHGQPLVGLQPGYSAQSERAGTIKLGFLVANTVEYVIELDDEQGYEDARLHRFDFSQGSFVDSNAGSIIMIDALGEWVFVDLSDPTAAALRFDFSVREPADAPVQIPPGESLSVSYRDPTRDARFVCATLPEGNSGDPEQPQKRRGCELYVGEELILSANLNDVGLDRIQAYRGALGPSGRNPYRRPETVIGMRVRHADEEPVAVPAIAD